MAEKLKVKLQPDKISVFNMQGELIGWSICHGVDSMGLNMFDRLYSGIDLVDNETFEKAKSIVNKWECGFCAEMTYEV